MMLVYFLQTLLPLALILWLAIWPPINRAGFWMLALAAALVTLMAALQGIWMFPPWWTPYLLAPLLLVVVTLRFFNASHRNFLPNTVGSWVSLAAVFIIATASGWQSWASLAARQMAPGPSVDLAWPLGPGIYLVASGGASATINAHAALLDPSHALHADYGGTGYAVDLIAIDSWGLRTTGIMPADPARYVIFGTPVMAPCAGDVVVAVDGRPDNRVPQVDEGHVAGNHVILRCNGIEILLAHLRQSTLQVAVGDSVRVGQQVGEVGNSGESSEPHLHIHAQMPGAVEHMFSGVPVAMRIDGRFLARNDRIDVTPGPANP